MDRPCILILGGTRSGKSRFAVELAGSQGQRVLFVATAKADDEEMHQRIQEHRRSRPTDWRTLELSRGVGSGLGREWVGEEVVVIDCLGLLVANCLAPNIAAAQAQARVEAEVRQLREALDRLPATFILVSQEVGLGIVPPTRLGRLYRDLLGKVNQEVAARATQVYFMVAGLPWKLKG